MSRTIQLLALRTLAGGALFGSSLMLPATVHGQTGGPERALLNYSLAAPQLPGSGVLWAPGSAIAPAGAEAERALLGRTAADVVTSYSDPTSPASHPNGSSVTGEQALLGKRIEQ